MPMQYYAETSSPEDDITICMPDAVPHFRNIEKYNDFPARY